MSKHLYFLVEGGTTLDLVKARIEAKRALRVRNGELLKQLGVTRYTASSSDGTIAGVAFEGAPHKDFKKPNKYGVCYPKAKSEWAARFADQQGVDERGYVIAEALGVPTDISYESEKVSGSGAIDGFGFHAGVGFLYLSADGPFALYVPDVASVVNDYESRGYTVDDRCKNFKPVFDGARPIPKEEWELIVAQHNVDKLKGVAA